MCVLPRHGHCCMQGCTVGVVGMGPSCGVHGVLLRGVDWSTVYLGCIRDVCLTPRRRCVLLYWLEAWSMRCTNSRKPRRHQSECIDHQTLMSFVNFYTHIT